MNLSDSEKTRDQLIAELEDMREKLIQITSLSELDAIFNALPDIYFRLDSDGTILDFKVSTPDKLYMKPEDFLGKTIREIFPEEIDRKLMNAIGDVKETKRLHIFEYGIPVGDNLHYYEARLTSFQSHFLCIIRNITERKLAEEEIKNHREHLQALVDERTIELETINRALQDEIVERRKVEDEYLNVEKELHVAREAAESANRLKSQFLANMSHDIRTPLNAILGFANLIFKGNIDEKTRDYTRKIINSGDVLLTLLNDILDFSKIEAGQLNIFPQTFDLDELIESIRSIFGFQFKQKGISFEITKSPTVPQIIYGDKWRIHQVLTNLISNAFKFTEHGGVSLDMDYTPSMDCIRFRVNDTGLGIPETDFMGIFQPFIRLQYPRSLEKGGTGIGLAICKTLAHLMGGDITVKSRVNIGSEFLFEIPANLQAASQWIQKNNERENREPQTCLDIERKLDNTLLIVDDNPVNQELILEQLKHAGFYSLLCANNAKEAIRLALDRRPDLILMDIQMPEIDGNEAIIELRESEYTGPIIAFSAFAMKEYIDKSLSIGANAYITKPIDFDYFFSEINSFLKEKKPNEHAPVANRLKPSISERVRRIFFNEGDKNLRIIDDALNGTAFESKKNFLKTIAHNYKGNAGFLGLTQLETAATALDRSFKNNEPEEELRKWAHSLRDALKHVLSSEETRPVKITERN